MKEKLGLRNVILWAVALALLSMFFASFSASAKMNVIFEGQYFEAYFSNVVWGCKSAVGYMGGEGAYQYLRKAIASAPGIIGALLLLLSSGGLVVITLLLKDAKLAKILTFVAAGAILVGGVMLFFVTQAPWHILREIMLEEGISTDIGTIKQMYAGAKLSSGYGIGGGIVSILFAGGVIASQLFVPDIKFIKSARKEEPKAE